jgi:hypothetical protein
MTEAIPWSSGSDFAILSLKKREVNPLKGMSGIILTYLNHFNQT